MKILRKLISTDLQGRVLSEHTEQLQEDADGNVMEIQSTAAQACPACGRIIAKGQDLRRCIECARDCCEVCATVCSSCKRGPICGNCSLGFAEKQIPLCHRCLAQLQMRLERQDRLVDEKIEFERLMNVYGAIGRLIQSVAHERGSISEAMLDLASLRLARKLSSLAERIPKEQNDGKKYLP